MYPGVDLEAYLRLMLGRLRTYLAVLQDTLDTWHWLDHLEQRPAMLADCLLWEELDAFEQIVGPAISLADYPRLAAYHQGCPNRDQFAGYVEAHPCPFTGRGMTSEAEILERVHEICAQIAAEDEK
jgi:hypothetical protein